MENAKHKQMSLQVLVSTMHQYDCNRLIEKMNIRSDAIVVNQCDYNKFQDFNYKGKKIRFLSFEETGVGLSRNNALMRASSDVVLFADDDVVYYNNYEEKILNEFTDPNVDVCIFNIQCVTPGKNNRVNSKKLRLHFFNAFHYGAVRIAVRTESIRQANIFFSLLFGGGARYSAGEDSLFICECLRKGLKLYTSPEFIGEVSHDKSTWFRGYNDKYFHDKGILFKHISKRWGRLLCLQFAIRHRKMFRGEKTWIEAYRLMLKGMKRD